MLKSIKIRTPFLFVIAFSAAPFAVSAATCQAGGQSSVPAAVETPSRPRTFDTSVESMKEFRPGSVYAKHIYGQSVSVGVFHIIKHAGKPLNIPDHVHGEEVFYTIKGKGKFAGLDLYPGRIVIIPAGFKHGGSNTHIEDGEELVLLSIISPPNCELGPEIGTELIKK